MSAVTDILPTRPLLAPSLEVVGMTKRFGSLTALDGVSMAVARGSFHALLGENGAGKSTLVKCMMGFYGADEGSLLLDGREIEVRNPREARALGIGMVYQHFTLVPSLTAAENLVIARADTPAIINWKTEVHALAAFLDRMPFRVPLDVPVGSLSAGEKQKLEILKLLYLDQRFLILDEPTSVLTPSEADEILGLLKAMAARQEITVLMITHKFREMRAFADHVTVLRRGKLAGQASVSEASTQDLARMMIGDTKVRERTQRAQMGERPIVLDIKGLSAVGNEGRPAVSSVSLQVGAGEIVGIAGVSGNGQAELLEALSGQRPIASGCVLISGELFEPNRKRYQSLKVFGLPEEPLKNATVPGMTVAQNMAFRDFDRAPISASGWWLHQAPMRARAQALIAAYHVKTPSPDTPIANLSGGNVQRAVLARELSGDVNVLIVANPCFGLDFASVAEIRAQIVEQRNKGAAVLLVSEDLDEILELSDRVVVMSGGAITYESPIAATDRTTIGHYMGGH